VDDTLPTHARTLPLYLAGLAVGRDIGVRLALEVVVAEMTRQADAAAKANATMPAPAASTTASRHAYASARLNTVAVIIAAHFR
jgi:hypothetical protein